MSMAAIFVLKLGPATTIMTKRKNKKKIEDIPYDELINKLKICHKLAHSECVCVYILALVCILTVEPSFSFYLFIE